MAMTLFHPDPAACRRLRVSSRARQGGFNFTEVLFAVMILGVGFIMVAAIFPVALKQTKLTGEEVVASTVARGGINYVRQLGLEQNVIPQTDLNTTPASTPPGPADTGLAIVAPDIPPDGTPMYVKGKVLSFRDDRLDPTIRDELWRRVSGNLILPEDNRVAWVGMFSRGVTYTNISGAPANPGDEAGGQPLVLGRLDPYAQVFVLGVVVRNRSTFEMGKDVRRFPNDTPAASATNSEPASLEPVPCFVTLNEGDLAPDTLTFTDASGSNAIDHAAAAEGAFVIVSDDRIPDDPATPAIHEAGQHNGKIVRLGVRVDVGTWELQPGSDMMYDINVVADPNDDYIENLPPRPLGQPASGDPASAFLVGRGWVDPTDPTSGRDGLAQDAAVFIGFIPAN